MKQIWDTECQTNPMGDLCQIFLNQTQTILQGVNTYEVYGIKYYNPTTGLQNYLNSDEQRQNLRVVPFKTWDGCNTTISNNYYREMPGGLLYFPTLMQKLRILIYNGDIVKL